MGEPISDRRFKDTCEPLNTDVLELAVGDRFAHLLWLSAGKSVLHEKKRLGLDLVSS